MAEGTRFPMEQILQTLNDESFILKTGGLESLPEVKSTRIDIRNCEVFVKPKMCRHDVRTLALKAGFPMPEDSHRLNGDYVLEYKGDYRLIFHVELVD